MSQIYGGASRRASNQMLLQLRYDFNRSAPKVRQQLYRPTHRHMGRMFSTNGMNCPTAALISNGPIVYSKASPEAHSIRPHLIPSDLTVRS